MSLIFPDITLFNKLCGLKEPYKDFSELTGGGVSPNTLKKVISPSHTASPRTFVKLQNFRQENRQISELFDNYANFIHQLGLDPENGRKPFSVTYLSLYLELAFYSKYASNCLYQLIKLDVDLFKACELSDHTHFQKSILENKRLCSGLLKRLGFNFVAQHDRLSDKCLRSNFLSVSLYALASFDVVLKKRLEIPSNKMVFGGLFEYYNQLKDQKCIFEAYWENIKENLSNTYSIPPSWHAFSEWYAAEFGGDKEDKRKSLIRYRRGKGPSKKRLKEILKLIFKDEQIVQLYEWRHLLCVYLENFNHLLSFDFSEITEEYFEYIKYHNSHYN